MKKFLLLLCFAVSTTLSTFATDYTVETTPAPASPTFAYPIPLYPSTSTYSSISQQLYLASELSALDAEAGDITGIKFYYGGKGNNTTPSAETRTIKIYITEMSDDALELHTISGEVTKYRFKFVNQGSLVYEGNITTENIALGEVKILPVIFNRGTYSWDGSKNILLTVFDVTDAAFSSESANLRFVYKATTTPRFVHYHCLSNSSDKASEYLGSLAGLEGESVTSGSGTAQEKETQGHLLVPKVTFTIESPVPAPTSPSASASTNSATISWTAAEGADSYEIRYGTTSGSLGETINNITSTSREITNLTEETTYYYQIRTKIGAAYSAWTDEASFTTLAETPFVYKEITFSKWNSTNSLPTEAGSYYLDNDVTLAANCTIPANINLCLNGHNINTYVYCIVVADGETLTIYDNESTGRISGYHVADFPYYGIINISSTGTLVLGEGIVQNLYGTEPSDAPNSSYAIYNNGTLKLSGTPTISGVDGDIFLGNSKVITIEPSKPLTNTTPYSIYKSGAGPITSGWANMSGADPKDYFASANSSLGVQLSAGGEAELVTYLALDQSTDNSTAIGNSYNKSVNITLTRPLVNTQYNTFCLPFAMNDAALQSYFGAGYDLEELTNATLDGNQLNLVFTKVNALEAGKPYLLQPSNAITEPMVFEGVTITANTPDNTVEVANIIDFVPIYAPTELVGGNKNYLFLGADNTLFFPQATGNMNGFRAYFKVLGSMPANVKARIVKATETATGIDPVTGNPSPVSLKQLRNGQLIIVQGDRVYNAQGQIIK